MKTQQYLVRRPGILSGERCSGITAALKFIAWYFGHEDGNELIIIRLTDK